MPHETHLTDANVEVPKARMSNLRRLSPALAIQAVLMLDPGMVSLAIGLLDLVELWCFPNSSPGILRTSLKL